MRIRYALCLISILTLGLSSCGPGPSHKQGCIANLKEIDGAKAEWARECHKANDDFVTWQDLVGPTNYIRDMLICPRGGKYTLGSLAVKPSCSCGQGLSD